MKEKELLTKIAEGATKLGQDDSYKYKHNTEVNYKVADSVLKSTSAVIREQLTTNNQPSVKVPYFGTFKKQFKEGGNKEMRRIKTGEKYFKEVPDKNILKFKMSKGTFVEYNPHIKKEDK